MIFNRNLRIVFINLASVCLLAGISILVFVNYSKEQMALGWIWNGFGLFIYFLLFMDWVVNEEPELSPQNPESCDDFVSKMIEAERLLESLRCLLNEIMEERIFAPKMKEIKEDSPGDTK